MNGCQIYDFLFSINVKILEFVYIIKITKSIPTSFLQVATALILLVSDWIVNDDRQKKGNLKVLQKKNKTEFITYK